MTQSLGDASWCAVRLVGWEPQAGGFLVGGSTRQRDRSDQHRADRTRFGISGDDNRDSNFTVTEGDLYTVEDSLHELGVRTVVTPAKADPARPDRPKNIVGHSDERSDGEPAAKAAIVLTGVADREPLAIRVTVGPYTVLVRWPNGDIDLVPRGVAHASRSWFSPHRLLRSVKRTHADRLPGVRHAEPGMLTGPSTGTPVCARGVDWAARRVGGPPRRPRLDP